MKDETVTSLEGARSFSLFIQQIDEGSLHQSLSAETHALMRELREHARQFARDAKGSLTLTISFEVDPKGVADVEADVRVKKPKTPSVSSQFFLTPSGNLTLENPRQQKLGLGIVPPPERRDVDVPTREPARSV